MASINPASLSREAAGAACVALLRILRRLPSRWSIAMLRPWLPLYAVARAGHVRRLRACFAAAPFAIGLTAYYRARLGILARGLRAHGRPPGAGAYREEGRRHYEDALASGRPVALLGLHAGPFELLHKAPPAPAGRPFRILTAPAFARALTRFMAEGRESGGKSVLWVGGIGDRGLERGLRDTAAAKGVLALMVDQHPGGAQAVSTLDLWDRIRVPWPERLLAFLAAKEFVLLPVSARYEGDGVAAIRYHEPLETPSVGAVRGFLEAAIAEAPEQWNWSYPKVVPSPPVNPLAVALGVPEPESVTGSGPA